MILATAERHYYIGYEQALIDICCAVEDVGLKDAIELVAKSLLRRDPYNSHAKDVIARLKEVL